MEAPTIRPMRMMPMMAETAIAPMPIGLMNKRKSFIDVHRRDDLGLSGKDEMRYLRAEMVDQRHEHQVGEHRSGGDHGGVTQPDDVAETKVHRDAVHRDFERIADIFLPRPPSSVAVVIIGFQAWMPSAMKS